MQGSLNAGGEWLTGMVYFSVGSVVIVQFNFKHLVLQLVLTVKALHSRIEAVASSLAIAPSRVDARKRRQGTPCQNLDDPFSLGFVDDPMSQQGLHGTKKLRVKGALCHCSGLMALHMDKLTRSEKPDPEGPLKDLCDADKESELKTMMANFGFKHHFEHNRHHPEHYCGKSMADIQVVHAVVDGLACILERKHVSSIKQWLDTFHAGGLRGRNLTLVQAVLQALDETLTETDFLNLTDFKRTIQMLIGESPVWSQIVMSVACKKNAPGTEEAITDFTHCCFTKK